MRLRTITAPDMPTAMRLVREELGENAVILSSATDKQSRRVKVTAAIEPDSLTPRKNVELEKLTAQLQDAQQRLQQRQWMDELAELLRTHNTPDSIITTMQRSASHVDLESLLVMQKLVSQQSKDALELRILSQILEQHFRFQPLDMQQPGFRIMLIGPPGIGKTLAIAKIAAQLVMQGHQPLVITTDTQRAGGIEQLKAFTDILNLQLHVADSPQDVAKIVLGASTSQHILIDTYGCNAYDTQEIDQLKVLVKAAGAEPILVLPACMDSYEAATAATTFSRLGAKRLLASRVDATRRLGSLLAAAEAGKLMFSNIGNTPRVVGELMPFSPQTLASLLLQYRAQRVNV